MKFFQAVLILSGMILGVGMLGIPYAFVRAGFWLSIAELAILAGVILFFHLLYADIVTATHTFHRMPGYVRLYLGRRSAFLSWLSAFFGISGTLLAYILVGSIFLHEIFRAFWNGSNEFFWAIALITAGAVITSLKLKREALVNGILTTLLIVFILFLAITLLPRVDTQNFKGFEPENFFIPYGVILFALSGGIVIPDLITFLGRNSPKIRSAIVLGSMIPAVLYFFFAYAVVGTLGNAVSEEAIRGLSGVVGQNIVILGGAIGFLAAFTSYIVMSASFQALLRLDFHMHTIVAWFAATSIPAILYFLGIQNFIAVIGAVGAVAVGIDSLLILAAHHAMRRVQGVRLFWYSYAWKFIVYATIGAGALHELYKFF